MIEARQLNDIVKNALDHLFGDGICGRPVGSLRLVVLEAEGALKAIREGAQEFGTYWREKNKREIRQS